MSQSISRRPATLADVASLAQMNQQLIEDAGHRNPTMLPVLESRMRAMLDGDYVATLFEQAATPVANALWRDEAKHIHLRQFFVARSHRRRGIGREAIRTLRDEVWPPGKRIRVNVLIGNLPGSAFWLAVGFRDYLTTLEMGPES